MSRGAKIAVGLLLALLALLAINTVIVSNETKSAGVTIEGGKILELPAGDVQVLVEGPGPPRPVERRGGGGSAPITSAPIVLIHCYSCSLHWWDQLAPILAQNHRVIRIDLLGHGGSEKPSSGYSIDDQAATVAAALDRLNVQGAVVVGHSMGFSVATALAGRASQLVDRLVNIDEGPDTETCELPFIARLIYAPVLGQALWRLAPDSLIEDGYGDAFAPDFDLAGGFPNPDQVVEDYEAMTFTSFREAHDANRDYTEEIALADRLRPLAIPLLSIFGTEDQICDPETSQEAYATVPGARLAEVDGAGHSPNVEKPKETAVLIEEFAADAGDDTIPPPPKNVGRDRGAGAGADGSGGSGGGGGGSGDRGGGSGGGGAG